VDTSFMESTDRIALSSDGRFLSFGWLGYEAYGHIVVDRTELEDARWFDRAELELMHKRTHPDGLFAAHPFAIAHHLIGQWLHNGKGSGA
jgi:NADH pyrophosphatase NudC (nudix superfamily)